MNRESAGELPLSPYRVLDLTDDTGWFCGRLMGDLGADVIKIERHGGDPGRNIGPFYHDIVHPETSLCWFTYNANKRSITLNLETTDGNDIFCRLVKTADFVIESFTPGYMKKLGWGYSALSKINPRIIMTSITPFGQKGPASRHKASDITLMARGGIMFLCGDVDRPPLRFSTEETRNQAGSQATVGTLFAHYHRELTGEGQHVDVSVLECMAKCITPTPQTWDLVKVIERRHGDRQQRGETGLRLIWPCKDGELCWRLWVGGQGFVTKATTEWMDEEGMAGDSKKVDWEHIGMEELTSKYTQEEIERLEEPFARFFLTKTKAEVQQAACKHSSLWISPVYTVSELIGSPQLKARDFWVKVNHPELKDTLTYAGLPFKSDKPLCRVMRRAPLIGEHNEEIYCGELGLSKQQLISLKGASII